MVIVKVFGLFGFRISGIFIFEVVKISIVKSGNFIWEKIVGSISLKKFVVGE